MIRNLRRNLRRNRGFTLVELMIVVAIVGILAALAIYGVSKYMKSAKTAEARNSLGQLAKDAAAAYNREKMAPGIMVAGESTGVSNALCAKADKSIPADKAAIEGKKYQSDPEEWNAEDSRIGWQCLKFSMSEPQYFMYSYDSDATSEGKEDEYFEAIANGDLDGDGVLSTFKLKGQIKGKQVQLSPAIDETDAEE